MKERYDGPPTTLNSLKTRLRNIVGGGAVDRTGRAMAGVVVGQMLPPGAIEGGAAMKLRLGEQGSRFTTDLDFARRSTLDQFQQEFAESLTLGWNGFTGRLLPKAAPRPAGVPTAYVMRPFDVKLAYAGKSWLTVPVEVGHDELDDTAAPMLALADDLTELFQRVGLPDPQPLPVLAAEHQIAQKLHACSEPGSERAHDLVDLQLLMNTGPVDLLLTATLCRRLFDSRRKHSWPPTIQAGPTWEGLYRDSVAGVTLVIPDLPGALDWANELVQRLQTQP